MHPKYIESHLSSIRKMIHQIEFLIIGYDPSNSPPADDADAAAMKRTFLIAVIFYTPDIAASHWFHRRIFQTAPPNAN